MGSRIMDATCPLAMPWNEAEKLKKKQRGIDPRDAIDIVQRSLVLIGNAHYVCLTDAINKGWGAVCNNVRIGGPWLITESHFYMNVLELMAIQNAAKSFLRNKSDKQVLIQRDKTALTYVNKMVGTVSNGCNTIALVIWCLQGNINPHI